MSVVHGLREGFAPAYYDAIVVGAGPAGSVCARSLAEGANMRVAVLERRDHVGGLTYDCLDEQGVRIHRYGPHVYHTSSERVHRFLSRFSDFTDYRHRVLVDVDGVRMPMPLNRRSLELAFGDDRGARLFDKLVSSFGEGKRVSIPMLLEYKDDDFSDVAEFLYDRVLARYVTKLWGGVPEQLEASSVAHASVFTGEENFCFTHAAYQGLPQDGYAKLFERMLDHDLIDVFVGVDALDLIRVDGTRVEVGSAPYGGEVIYTGSLDALFGWDSGRLPTCGMGLEFVTLDVDRSQKVGSIIFTGDEAYARVTEFKVMTGQRVAGKTTMLREYPVAAAADDDISMPRVPIRDSGSVELYRSYQKRVDQVLNLHAVGVFAEFKAMDMGTTINSALELSDDIINDR